MLRGVFESASALLALQHAQSLIADNLANANTPGYESTGSVFGTFLAAQVQNASTGSPVGPYGFGVSTVSDVRTLTPGPLQMTGRALDVAPGPGVWIRIVTPTGPRWTRDGALTVDALGNLTTPAGYPVQSTQGGPLRIGTALNAKILPSGQVEVAGQTVGTIALDVASRGQKLVPTAPGVFTALPGAGLTPGGTVTPGALVQSNVNPAAELASLVQVLGSYQANEQAVNVQAKALDTLLTTGVEP